MTRMDGQTGRRCIVVCGRARGGALCYDADKGGVGGGFVRQRRF